MPHRSWWIPQKHRVVDIKGLVVAVAFLVAISLFAGGRGGKAGGDPSPPSVAGDTGQTVNAFLEGEQAPPDPSRADRQEEDPPSSAAPPVLPR